MITINLIIYNGKIFTLLIINRIKMTTIQPNTSIPDSKALELSSQVNPAILNPDRINPTRSYSAYYIDESLWGYRIARIADLSAAAERNVQKASESTPHASLDSLCTKELEKRYPKGFRITNFTGVIERCMHAFMKVFGKSYTSALEIKYQKQISYSACNRSDLRSKITIQDPSLRKELQITSDDALSTTHTLAKNSPLNAQSYLDEEGEKKTLTSAIASLEDKKSGRARNLTRVASFDGTSIAYTGRIKNGENALEEASFIFLSELRSKKKGITTQRTESGEEIYKLDYVAACLLPTDPLSSAKSSLSRLKESRALKELKSRGVITITDPEDGKTYKVVFNPLLLSESRIATDIQSGGVQKLRSVLENKLSLLRSQKESSTSHPEIETKIGDIEKAWKLCHSDEGMSIEEKLFHRDYLCKLLEIPVVYHGAKSTDKIEVLIALSSALQQWIDLKLSVPEPVSKLFSDDRFKELFAANLLSGHQITRYIRAKEEVVHGQVVPPASVTHNFSKKLFQNEAIQKLMPERYLKAVSLQKKILVGSSIFAIHILSIPLFAIQTLWDLGKWIASGFKREKLNSWKNVFPIVIATSLINKLRSIPKKVLDLPSSKTEASSVKKPSVAVSDTPCKIATTSDQYKKALADFKKNVRVSHACKKAEFSQSVKESFTLIKENIRISSDYNYQEALDGIKSSVLSTLGRDLERISLVAKNRSLIIKGKKYGYSPDCSIPIQDQVKNQPAEIYEILKQFYLKAQPQLGLIENRLNLEEKVLFAIDQLHQGATVPLLEALIDQFHSDNFPPLGNKSYHFELELDPHEILSDGQKGSLLLRRRLVTEVVSFSALENRCCSDEVKEAGFRPESTDEYGLPIYKDQQIQAEGLVFAECLEEIREKQPLSIRYGVL